MMTFRFGAFETWVDREGGALRNRIHVLTEENSESFFTPLTMWGYNEKMAIYEPECKTHQIPNLSDSLTSDFP